jgi:hypothetical protein
MDIVIFDTPGSQSILDKRIIEAITILTRIDHDMFLQIVLNSDVFQPEDTTTLEALQKNSNPSKFKKR